MDPRGNKRQIVHDLKVSNNHGSITFAGEVELSKVQVEDVVVLKYQEIEMYPNQNIPAEGTNLNRPARVELYKMTPELKGSAVPPYKYEKMLKKSNSKAGATFISYKDDGGDKGWVWTFEVKNFNRKDLS